MPDRRTFLKTSAAGAAGLAWVDPLHAFTAAPDAAAAPLTLRFRQVHLDFHTSPLIPDVAKDFDPERYADTLARAHVDSVTTFARCHHGLIYYDTKAFPERRHPNLRRNLLPEQVAACHRRNIRVPIYVTVQWDQFTADAHPEWRIVTETGALEGVLTVLAIHHRIAPATINLDDFDTEIKLDVVHGEARKLPEGDIAALNNSFGFGGHNVAVTFTSV